MPGIYLHIPFCKQACHYCNFHFSTSLRLKTPMVEAILRELDLQKGYLGGSEITSVYFGGGTPSLLETSELQRIFEKIHSLHRVRADAEITLEANPDDLTLDKLRDLRDHTPVNRLSIGIQSFSDADLRWMNRAHTAEHARLCIENARAVGFENLTVDLIYGAPTTSDAQWHENVRTVFALGIPHISCYCLTVEDGTALGSWVKKGKQPPMDEEKAAQQFEWLIEAAAAEGFEHYEISNFARPGWRARHNSSYWSGEKYLGIGPSAHSFDGAARQWNVANNALYIKTLEAGTIPFEREILSPTDRYNEYVMTSLRTMWGCDLAKIRELGVGFAEGFERAVQPFVAAGTVVRTGEVFTLPARGKLLADRIASELFFSKNDE
ncbi:MAG: radical SAM family heme chaperone HemW [Saprospiraceae bacterium]